MGQKRQIIHPGTILTLGETAYRIEGLEGCGNNALVYRASYEDGLIRGAFHQVLIKELFPYSLQGWVYRLEDGRLCCTPGHKDFFEYHLESFRKGNKANLELLEKAPDQIAGNLNSCEAYGTCYTVLALHGGKTLAQVLQERELFQNFRAIIVCLLQILDSLEQFHKNGILHLDISPDNILILPKRTLLIDYNSVWPVARSPKETLFFSIKEGYTAPEVRLLEKSEVGAASDLYALCAVFYQMVTGERLSDGMVLGNQLGKTLLSRIGDRKDIPSSAAWKAAQILYKGLQTVPRIRYQSVGELRGEFFELLRRIDGKGITFHALWESSRRKKQKHKWVEKEWFERQIGVSVHSPEGVAQFFNSLCHKQNYLLTGGGGIGKTSLLFRIWKENLIAYRPTEPVVCYISLSGYQESEGESSCYIRKTLLRQLSFGKEIKDMEEAMHQLDRMLEGQETEKEILVLLLDGLNEAGKSRSGLLWEIEKLGSSPVTAILVTDRTGEVKSYGLRGYQEVSLLPMAKTAVETILGSHGFAKPQTEELCDLLTNPMMLSLYIKTMENRETQQQTELPGCHSIEDLVGNYLDALHSHEMRVFSGNRTEQLGISYTLSHLLPAIAGEMQQRNKSMLTLEEMCRVTDKSFKNLRKKSFTMAFPNYLGKSREMLHGIRDEKEWFDYAVREQLKERLNLLEESEQGGWRLIHENFAGCLAGRDGDNRKKVRGYGRKIKIRNVVAGFLLAVMLGGAGIVIWIRSRPFPATQQEIAVVENAMERLTWEIHILDTQLQNQDSLMEAAEKEDVLAGEEKALKYFAQTMERKRKELRRQNVSLAGDEESLEELAVFRNILPLNLMRAFYERPDQLLTLIEACMNHMEEGLQKESIYHSPEKKKILIETYREYLQKYAAVCYLEIMQILFSLKGEQKDYVMEALTKTPTFAGFVVSISVSSMTKEELERQKESAENNLWDAENKMRQQNYIW